MPTKNKPASVVLTLCTYAETACPTSWIAKLSDKTNIKRGISDSGKLTPGTMGVNMTEGTVAVLCIVVSKGAEE